MICTSDGRNKVDQTLNGSGAKQSRVEQNKVCLKGSKCSESCCMYNKRLEGGQVSKYI